MLQAGRYFIKYEPDFGHNPIRGMPSGWVHYRHKRVMIFFKFNLKDYSLCSRKIYVFCAFCVLGIP